MSLDTVPTAAIDDPEWVRARYLEAKELLSEIRTDLYAGDATLASDLCERIEHFWLDTFMDRCTTMSFDCGCNHD